MDKVSYKKLFENERKKMSILSNKKENVLGAKILTFGNSCGDYATLIIGKETLKCFFPDFSKYGWNLLDNNGQLKVLDGKNIRVFLEIFLIQDKDLKKEKIGNTKMTIKQNNFNYSSINGKIIAEVKGLEKFVCADSGLPIYIKLPKNCDFKTGDWIEATGRLDAYLVNNKQFAEGKDET